MSLSLRDQLLQAGFKPSAPEPKPAPKPAHKPPPGKHAGKPPHKPHVPQPERPSQAARPRVPKDGEPSLAHAYQLRAETEKREREEAQRRAEEAARLKREQRAKLAALIAGKSLNSADAEHVRNFAYGKKIRKVNVTPDQLHALNTGELGVVQVDGRMLIVAAETVREVFVLAPQHVALFIPEGIGASAGADEDYADPRFQVPDDLAW